MATNSKGSVEPKENPQMGENEETNSSGTSQDDPGSEIQPVVYDEKYVQQLKADLLSYKSYKKTAKELEERLKKIEEAELSEKEKLTKKIADLEKEKETMVLVEKQRVLNLEIQLHAQKAGIVDVDAAYKLIDQNQIQFDEDGNPTNVDVLIKELATKRPWLIPQTSSTTSTGNPPANRSSKLTVEEIKAMSPEEVNRRWDEVQSVLKGK